MFFNPNEKGQQGEVVAGSKSQQGCKEREGNSCGQSERQRLARLRSDGRKTILPGGGDRVEVETGG